MLNNLNEMPNSSPNMILRGSLCTCELFSVPDLRPQPNFPAMNLARRAPALFNFKKNVLAVAGCSGPGQHLTEIESIQFDGKNLEGNWKICEMKAPNAFSCAAFCQFADDTAFAFGGFDGRHCTRQSLLLRPSLPYPSSVHSLEPLPYPSSVHSLEPLPYPSSVHSLEPLPYGVKNGVAVVARDCGESKGRLLWLVGGWDGHRTLKTVFEYAFPEQNCSLKHILPYPIEGHSIAKSSVVAPQKAFIAGGFDGIGLRADFLAMDLRTGAVELIAGIALEKPRENHCSVIFGDGQGNEWLAIIGGWDGHKALSDWEIFELLPDAPWLRRTDIGPWGEKPATLATARNRPATILI
uniref:Uncharacterized protein n=1 Tax=Globodera rostochiensis TaxID=31243 RepID=A0A914HFJ3_GLORO